MLCFLVLASQVLFIAPSLQLNIVAPASQVNASSLLKDVAPASQVNASSLLKDCPPGQFMLHDKDKHPVECHNLSGNKTFKLLIHGKKKMNAYLGNFREGIWGGAHWAQNSFRNDADYSEALNFHVLEGNRLYLNDRPISTLYDKWRYGDPVEVEKMWTIKNHADHPDPHLLELSTINNGLLARIGEKGRDRAHECVMEAPELTIKYGYTVAECGPDAFPHYSFLLVV